MPLRYLGGKASWADKIVEQFPPHVTYVEPFCGAASVFFQKHPSQIEVLNDLYQDLVNFFTVLRTRTQELLWAINCTPYAYQEYLLCYKPCEDELERARRFYVRSRQTYGGATPRKSGWRRMKNMNRNSTPVSEWKQIDHLLWAADRLKDAQIECAPALPVIQRYDAPTTLFYLDPPYPKSTRSDSGSAKYAFEMTDDDHRELAAVLHNLKGMAIISSYDSPLYQELYGGWRLVKKVVGTNGGRNAVEHLYISPKADDIYRLPLLAMLRGGGRR